MSKRILLIIVVVVVALAVFLLRGYHNRPEPGPVAGAEAGSVLNSNISGTSQPGASSTNVVLPAAAADAMPQTLAELEKQLSGLDRKEAVARIQRWLDSGKDAATGQEFKLAANGSLANAPTLRTFLLDRLSRLDPEAAAAYAEKILAAKSSPDEWAIAMRAYALGHGSDEGATFLQGKFREMLQAEEWRQNPSVGFLEAFDVAVFTHATGLVPDFAGYITATNNRAVTHASYLALDRLVQTDPTVVLGQLQAQPGLMTGHESTRADYFARTDVRDDRQRKILENYLLDPQRSAVELQQFVGVYPNANYMISHNLLSATVTPTGAELAARDRDSLRVVNEWLADPRFAARRPQLESIKERLEQFVNAAQHQ